MKPNVCKLRGCNDFIESSVIVKNSQEIVHLRKNGRMHFSVSYTSQMLSPGATKINEK